MRSFSQMSNCNLKSAGNQSSRECPVYPSMTSVDMPFIHTIDLVPNW